MPQKNNKQYMLKYLDWHYYFPWTCKYFGRSTWRKCFFGTWNKQKNKTGDIHRDHNCTNQHRLSVISRFKCI